MRCIRIKKHLQPVGGGGGLLSNNQLKIIAMLSMLIDHAGVMIFPGNQFLRIIGRLSFPIFAYMIAEGAFYTRSKIKYLFGILWLGLLCQLVFYAFSGSLYQGILITFSLSVAVIAGADGYLKTRDAAHFALMIAAICVFAWAAVTAPVVLERRGYYLDYGAVGAALPVALYFCRGKAQKLMASAVILALMASMSPSYQWYALIALPLLATYSGKRGSARLKYMFYVFYPAHFAFLGVLYVVAAAIKQAT